MEDPSASTTSDETWAEEIAEALGQQRSQVREFLAAHRDSLDQSRTQLAEQIEEVAESLDRGRAETARAREEIERRNDDVEGQVAALERLKRDLDARQAQWEDVHREAIGRYEALTERLEAQQEAQEAERSDRLRSQIDEQLQRFDEQSTELRTALERKNELDVEVEAARRREAELNDRLQVFERQCDALREDAARGAEADDADRGRFEALQTERDDLAYRLAETEQRLAAVTGQLSEVEQQLAQAPQAAESGADDELKRRYEMAMDDVRELKQQNRKLEEDLAQAETARPSAAGSSGALDWEAEKRRILEVLDADFDDNNEEDKAQRLKIEEVVERTDGLVAEKDREIRELKQLLEVQSTSHGEVAVGAAALGEILDNDAIVREEREKLYRLQGEWEEKLREAELEVSVERAKLGRQRTEIEEQLRTLEDLKGGSDAQADAQPKGGRWLTRLGLKE